MTPFFISILIKSIKDDGHQGGTVGQDTLRYVNLCCPIPNEVPVVIKYLARKEKRGEERPPFRLGF